MIAPLNFLKVSFIFIASLLLLACHSDGPSKKEPPEINTFQIYTFEQSIYSFNEDTGISTKRGEFDLGENQFVELNTDESKQGYEYAVYVFENTLYLFNYDKAQNAQTIELAELLSSRIVCGITPHTTASQASFSDQESSNRNSLDLPIITIEYKETDQSCGSALNTRDTLDFSSVLENSENTRDIEKMAGTSEKTLGGLIIDYASNNNPIDLGEEGDDRGSSGFLGKNTTKVDEALNVDTLIFNFKIDGEQDQWKKVFSPSSGVEVIKQVSKDQVLVQEGNDIFVLKTTKLFTVNSEQNNTPVQERIDAMFSSSSATLDTNNPIESNNSQNAKTFLIKQDNKLYYYESEKFKQIPANETPGAIKVTFDITNDNTALVIQEDNDLQTLIAIPTATGFSTTILTAEKVEFYIIDNEFYVNTLELEQGSGWQAHWFRKSNSNYIKSTYDNSRFIFIKNLQEKLNSIYLLSSNNESSSSSIIKPALYGFDKSQTNGRRKGRSSSNGSVDFSYGQLNTDVSNILSSIIVNDLYGRITLQGTNDDTNAGRAAEEYYYFNPSQTTPNPDINEQSLTLIRRVERIVEP